MSVIRGPVSSHCPQLVTIVQVNYEHESDHNVHIGNVRTRPLHEGVRWSEGEGEKHAVSCDECDSLYGSCFQLIF